MKAILTLPIVIALLSSCNNTNSFDKTNADPLEVGVAMVDITPRWVFRCMDIHRNQVPASKTLFTPKLLYLNREKPGVRWWFAIYWEYPGTLAELSEKGLSKRPGYHFKT